MSTSASDPQSTSSVSPQRFQRLATNKAAIEAAAANSSSPPRSTKSVPRVWVGGGVSPMSVAGSTTSPKIKAKPNSMSLARVSGNNNSSTAAGAAAGGVGGSVDPPSPPSSVYSTMATVGNNGAAGGSGGYGSSSNYSSDGWDEETTLIAHKHNYIAHSSSGEKGGKHHSLKGLKRDKDNKTIVFDDGHVGKMRGLLGFLCVCITRYYWVLTSLVLILCAYGLVYLSSAISTRVKANRSSSRDSLTHSGRFYIESDGYVSGQEMNINYTCLGNDVSPPLSWGNVPANTEQFYVQLQSDSGKIHWSLYDLDDTLTHLDENTDEGRVGGTYPDRPKYNYTGPCSKGPGQKTYTMTIFAIDSDMSHLLSLLESETQTNDDGAAADGDDEEEEQGDDKYDRRGRERARRRRRASSITTSSGVTIRKSTINRLRRRLASSSRSDTKATTTKAKSSTGRLLKKSDDDDDDDGDDKKADKDDDGSGGIYYDDLFRGDDYLEKLEEDDDSERGHTADVLYAAILGHITGNARSVHTHTHAFAYIVMLTCVHAWLANTFDIIY